MATFVELRVGSEAGWFVNNKLGQIAEYVKKRSVDRGVFLLRNAVCVRRLIVIDNLRFLITPTSWLCASNCYHSPPTGAQT